MSAYISFATTEENHPGTVCQRVNLVPGHNGLLPGHTPSSSSSFTMAAADDEDGHR